MNEAAANVLLKTLEDPGQATLNFNSNHHRVLTSYPGIPRRAYPLLSPRPRSDAPSSHRTRLRGTADPTRYLSNGSGMSRQSDRLLAITRVTSPSAAARAIAATPLIPLEALELARLLVKTLEVSTQIWLSEWLQQFER